MKCLEDVKHCVVELLFMVVEKRPTRELQLKRMDLLKLWNSLEFAQYRENLGKLVGMVPEKVSWVSQQDNPYWNNYLATQEAFARVCGYKDLSSPDFVLDVGILKTDLQVMALHEQDLEQAFRR